MGGGGLGGEIGFLHPMNCVSECGDIADVEESTVFFIANDFGETAGAGGDDGPSAGHCFEGDVSETFFEGGGGHEAAVLQEPAFIGGLDEPGEQYAVGEG